MKKLKRGRCSDCESYVPVYWCIPGFWCIKRSEDVLFDSELFMKGCEKFKQKIECSDINNVVENWKRLVRERYQKN